MYKVAIALFLAVCARGFSDNQTPDAELTPLSPNSSLPFEITIQLADFQLPSDSMNSVGIQGFCSAMHSGKWLLIAGRTNGIHGFQNDDTNFPFLSQNTTVYVVDPKTKSVKSRSLFDPTSQLSQSQIETLSVTDAQFFQVGNTLYIAGGYGFDSQAVQFNTKSTLTVIDLPGFIKWVESGKHSAKKYIRQTTHPLLQVTGGFLAQTDPHSPFLLGFGQNFSGANTFNPITVSNQQIRAFQIVDNGKKLYIQPEKQHASNPNYSRTGVNVVPIMQKVGKSLQPSYVALSGVFTPTIGVWTVPIFIKQTGSSFMPNPSSPGVLNQSINNYACANVGLYSKKSNDMFTILFGGLGYLGDDLIPSAQIPFINTVTTVRIDTHGNFYQYLMDNKYPVITSRFANPGNTLLFGTVAQFFPAGNLEAFPNGVLSLDDLGSSPILLGYIVGGVQSTEINTNSLADSSSSPLIFSVILQRR